MEDSLYIQEILLRCAYDGLSTLGFKDQHLGTSGVCLFTASNFIAKYQLFSFLIDIFFPLGNKSLLKKAALKATLYNNNS